MLTGCGYRGLPEQWEHGEQNRGLDCFNLVRGRVGVGVSENGERRRGKGAGKRKENNKIKIK